MCYHANTVLNKYKVVNKDCDVYTASSIKKNAVVSMFVLLPQLIDNSW